MWGYYRTFSRRYFVLEKYNCLTERSQWESSQISIWHAKVPVMGRALVFSLSDNELSEHFEIGSSANCKMRRKLWIVENL